MKVCLPVNCSQLHAAAGTRQNRAVAGIRKTIKRLNAPGHAHELTFTCYRRRPLLSTDRARRWVIEALELARARHSIRIWAFVIMPNHVHLLFHPRRDDYDVGRILKTIKQSVARKALAFLRKHSPKALHQFMLQRKRGNAEYTFWQEGPGCDRNIWSPEAVASVIDYIHNNPVRRGLAESPTDWQWSSARNYALMDGCAMEIDPADSLSVVRSQRRRRIHR